MNLGHLVPPKKDKNEWCLSIHHRANMKGHLLVEDGTISAKTNESYQLKHIEYTKPFVHHDGGREKEREIKTRWTPLEVSIVPTSNFMNW